MSRPAIAVATDVGAWRVVWPVVEALWRRSRDLTLMLAEPAASYARAAGLTCVRLDAPSLEERAQVVLAERPSILLLGTSVQQCVERALTRQARGRVPTLGVLDAMLFAELRFDDWSDNERAGACGGERGDALGVAPGTVVGQLGGAHGGGARDGGAGSPPEARGGRSGHTRGGVQSDARAHDALAARTDDDPAARSHGAPPARPGRLGDLPDVLACPDEETVERLLHAGAPAGSAIATGNPTLAEIGLMAAHYAPPPACRGSRQPIDVLFVSQAVTNRHLPGRPFSIDERRTLDDVLTTLGDLRGCAPHGFRVRVRWHPTQRPDRVPTGPDGVTVEPDDDADRLRSAGRARVVVGLSSTLMGEARMLGRAAIAYLPGPYWDHEPVYPASLGVRLARTTAQLRADLRTALLDPPEPPPLAEHLGAADRIADLFDRLTGPSTV